MGGGRSIVGGGTDSQGEMASICGSLVYWEEDEGGVERYALRSASAAISPEAERIWVGDSGVESVVKFV